MIGGFMQFYWQSLKTTRKNLKISVNFIINKMSICRKTYWLWENGKRIPSESDVRNLAKVMGVEVSILSDMANDVLISKESAKSIAINSMFDSGQLYGSI